MPNRKVRLSPPPAQVPDVNSYKWRSWFSELRERLGETPFQIQGYAVAALPNAADWGSVSANDPFSSLIFVYDESGGPVMAYSNGTNWLRVTDGAIVT